MDVVKKIIDYGVPVTALLSFVLLIAEDLKKIRDSEVAIILLGLFVLAFIFEVIHKFVKRPLEFSTGFVSTKQRQEQEKKATRLAIKKGLFRAILCIGLLVVYIPHLIAFYYPCSADDLNSDELELFYGNFDGASSFRRSLATGIAKNEICLTPDPHNLDSAISPARLLAVKNNSAYLDQYCMYQGLVIAGTYDKSLDLMECVVLIKAVHDSVDYRSHLVNTPSKLDLSPQERITIIADFTVGVIHINYCDTGVAKEIFTNLLEANCGDRVKAYCNWYLGNIACHNDSLKEALVFLERADSLFGNSPQLELLENIKQVKAALAKMDANNGENSGANEGEPDDSYSELDENTIDTVTMKIPTKVRWDYDWHWQVTDRTDNNKTSYYKEDGAVVAKQVSVEKVWALTPEEGQCAGYLIESADGLLGVSNSHGDEIVKPKFHHVTPHYLETEKIMILVCYLGVNDQGHGVNAHVISLSNTKAFSLDRKSVYPFFEEVFVDYDNNRVCCLKDDENGVRLFLYATDGECEDVIQQSREVSMYLSKHGLGRGYPLSPEPYYY